LLRLALDPIWDEGDAEDPAIWGPLHAWRALCEFRDADAILPLTALWEKDNDWPHEDLMELFPDFGPVVLAPMLTVLDDPKRRQWARMDAVTVIGRVGERYPESRAECVAHLAERLERFAFLSAELNAMLVSALIDLRAVECAPLMERAFAADAVEEGFVGDWSSVQYELGLIEELPPADRGRTWYWGNDSSPFAYGMSSEQRKKVRKQRAKEAQKLKAKRRHAKQQRKRNR
jgi:hypothetical protein